MGMIQCLEEMDDHEWQDVEESTKENGAGVANQSPNKRTAAERDGEVSADTPLKKMRRASSGEAAGCGDEWIPPAPSKRGKRKLGQRN